jgi:hypothetical protein
VTDVLDNVKQTDRRKSLCQYSGVLQSRLHHMPYTALDGIPNPCKSWLDENHVKTGLLHGTRDTTVAAANIKYGSPWREVFHRFKNAMVPVFKPEG